MFLKGTVTVPTGVFKAASFTLGPHPGWLPWPGFATPSTSGRINSVWSTQYSQPWYYADGFNAPGPRGGVDMFTTTAGEDTGISVVCLNGNLGYYILPVSPSPIVNNNALSYYIENYSGTISAFIWHQFVSGKVYMINPSTKKIDINLVVKKYNSSLVLLGDAILRIYEE